MFEYKEKTMVKKSFQKYIEKRLTKSEIDHIEHQAKLEKRALQNRISALLNLAPHLIFTVKK